MTGTCSCQIPAASSLRNGLGELQPAVLKLGSLSLHRPEFSAEVDQLDVVSGGAGEFLVQFSLAAREPRELPVESGELLPGIPQPRNRQTGLAGAGGTRRTLSIRRGFRDRVRSLRPLWLARFAGINKIQVLVQP